MSNLDSGQELQIANEAPRDSGIARRWGDVLVSAAEHDWVAARESLRSLDSPVIPGARMAVDTVSRQISHPIDPETGPISRDDLTEKEAVAHILRLAAASLGDSLILNDVDRAFEDERDALKALGRIPTFFTVLGGAFPGRIRTSTKNIAAARKSVKRQLR